ncbi:PilZ domain-containing protein [Qipengyuania nanhaisediminis]|uniref:PilZ domain-containing protein n=1 Tax=Qipengyuania nanhaisediminis TaxID=604088 RepID=UPI0038B2C5A2
MDQPAHFGRHDHETDGLGSDAVRPEDDVGASDSENPQGGQRAEARGAERFALLIRAAKLVTSQGEFVCVLRDVSETGVSVRMFHRLPHGDPIELHMPGRGVYPLKTVWTKDKEAGFEFASKVDIGAIIGEADAFPKRGMRLGVFFPIRITTVGGMREGVIENLSQQGARFECEERYAIDQSLRIEGVDGGEALTPIRAKVRWRRENQYGVVFDDTLALGDFARLVASLQCPGLLD